MVLYRLEAPFRGMIVLPDHGVRENCACPEYQEGKGGQAWLGNVPMLLIIKKVSIEEAGDTTLPPSHTE